MTSLSLVLSVMMAWMPTVDGNRVSLPYTHDAIPYVLGISVPPPDVAHITITQGDTLFDGYASGEVGVGVVTGYDPVLFYEDGRYVGCIVPEPATISMLIFGTLLLRRKRCR